MSPLRLETGAAPLFRGVQLGATILPDGVRSSARAAMEPAVIEQGSDDDFPSAGARPGSGVHPLMIELVKALARASAREYAAQRPRDGEVNASPAVEEPRDESRPVRTILKRRAARRIDR
jgi:hypothetical protein